MAYTLRALLLLSPSARFASYLSAIDDTPSAADYYHLAPIKLDEYELRAYYSKQTFKMDSDFNVKQDRRPGNDMVLLAYT
jgi:hypothetical protein